MQNVLVFGASYGSLFAMKLVMAGHAVTLVCRDDEADLINRKGTEVRLPLRGDADVTIFRSGDQPGSLAATTPVAVDTSNTTLVIFAMQEPQYSAPEIEQLVKTIAMQGLPCLSIMNMPPLAYMRRILGDDTGALAPCYAAPRVWDHFDPDLVTLCSPDPQAVRPPDQPLNVLRVGLATNFKAAVFGNPAATTILRELERDIAATRFNGRDVPVKLRVHESVYVPLAKWSMLLTGNYRAITRADPRSICDAVHTDLEASQSIYSWTQDLVAFLGASPEDHVPFAKYAKAAESLVNPSSAARAIAAGAHQIERVDKLIQRIARTHGRHNHELDQIVTIVDDALAANA
ncbi:MAG: hypothetical protein OXC91_11455 [Rhodobacteraceae bacterium]|nr:hypothetical protein [Paracoccaceae bacterium]